MEAVIFVGIQASGKTTFYRDYLFNTHIRLNLDMLRTRHREQLLVEACIAAKQPFVMDNTNVLAAERARYITAAKAARFRVVGYFFEPDVDRALEWNRERSDARDVPIKGLLGTFKRLEPPRLEEGFDALYTVRIGPDREFVIEEWAEEAERGAGGAGPT